MKKIQKNLFISVFWLLLRMCQAPPTSQSQSHHVVKLIQGACWVFATTRLSETRFNVETLNFKGFKLRPPHDHVMSLKKLPCFQSCGGHEWTKTFFSWVFVHLWPLHYLKMSISEECFKLRPLHNRIIVVYLWKDANFQVMCWSWVEKRDK